MVDEDVDKDVETVEVVVFVVVLKVVVLSEVDVVTLSISSVVNSI